MKNKDGDTHEMRKASIKETGEELSQEQWARFDAAVAEDKARRAKAEPFERGTSAREPSDEAPRTSVRRGPPS